VSIWDLFFNEGDLAREGDFLSVGYSGLTSMSANYDHYLPYLHVLLYASP
jgi:hypothetical protein